MVQQPSCRDCHFGTPGSIPVESFLRFILDKLSLEQTFFRELRLSPDSSLPLMLHTHYTHLSPTVAIDSVV